MAALAFLILAIPILSLGGFMMGKFLDQKDRDRNRRTYKLYFPADLDSDRATAFVRSLSGTLIAKNHRLGGVPTLVLETWATQQGIEHKLKVPWTHADHIVQQLRSLVPGIRVEPEDEWPERRRWTQSVEVGLRQSHRQLRIYNGADAATSILASLQPLEAGETVMVQWVVSPMTPERLPIHGEAKSTEQGILSLLTNGNASRDEVNDRRDKLAEPNVLAVLRVGAIVPTKESGQLSKARADHLVFRVRAAITGVRGPAAKFVKRFVSQQKLSDRIALASAPMVFPMQLSAPELTALLGWPIGNPFVTGLPAPMSKQLPTPISVPAVGRVIGRSTFPGNERPVALGYAEALQHLWLLGPTGSGKSVTLTNIVKQDMERGYGVIVMEPQGTLIQGVIDVVPRERLNDVILLDVNDTDMPVGFNLLQQGNPHTVADELAALFEHLYESNGVWAKELFFFGLRTLASDDQSTFLDLVPLIMPTDADYEWRRKLISNLRDTELREFWQRLDAQPPARRQTIAQPVLDRIWQLTARRELRNIIGQPQSSFLMDDVVRDNKILLVNLSKLPRESAGLMGTLIMNSVWHSVQSVRSDKPTFLHLDEFQRFVNLPIEPDDMLARARGLGLGMTLAHQHLEQLPNNVQQAVLNNAKSKVVFQTGAEDARIVAREFGTTVGQADFQNLARYETLARIMTPTGMSPPVTVATAAPPKSVGTGREVLYRARQTYGRPVAEVEQQIRARNVGAPGASEDGQRPTIDGWD